MSLFWFVLKARQEVPVIGKPQNVRFLGPNQNIQQENEIVGFDSINIELTGTKCF